jgi:DDE superfamily endonuclease
MLRVLHQTPGGIMEPQLEAGFPATLGRWVGEIVLSIPRPARRTVAELIVGGLLAGGGHVTQAFLALTPRLGWQAYHWMLERGRLRLLSLLGALCGIVRREDDETRRFAIIDDTLAPRASAKGPGAAVRFDHARKRNRPSFLLCQAFVTLGTVVACRDRARCVPIVTGLCRSSGNAGKIALARTLLRVVGNRLGSLCLLLDAWYMRVSLIQAALRRGHAVIGQVRRDTALFGLPPRAPGRRGRPRVDGERIDAAAAGLLPASMHRIAGYGGRAARLRHVLCRPRFLRGVVVRAVWCELAKPQGGWAKQRLLLSTDPDLSASAVVEAYAQRWSVEPLFAALKLTDGMGAMWQQGRRTLLRWLHLIQIGRALLVLLSARAEPAVLALLRVGGWRKATTLTPGLVKDALARRFGDIEAFRLLPTTQKKTGPARGTGPPVSAAAA